MAKTMIHCQSFGGAYTDCEGRGCMQKWREIISNLEFKLQNGYFLESKSMGLRVVERVDHTELEHVDLIESRDVTRIQNTKS